MYIYGKNVVKEALDNNKKINKAYVYKNFNDADILNQLKNKNITYVEKYELDKMVKENHQGIILSVDDFKYNDIEEFINKEDSFVVILDHIMDPHNFGAIIRTCEAAGIDGIIIPKDRSIEVNSTVIKVSAGAIENMKIASVTNLVNTMKYLKEKGFWIIGTSMEGTDYSKLDYNNKVAIVIGNEGTGMSRLVKENCDFIASIPMIGKINSLNASVATGVIIYGAIGKRNEI